MNTMQLHQAARRTHRPFIIVSAILWALVAFVPVPPTHAQTTQDCLDCHDDAEMVAEDGHSVGIPAKLFTKSLHGEQDCVDCHSAPGNFEDTPHWKKYTAVNCVECHDEARGEFKGSIHADLFADGDITCTSCHEIHQTAVQMEHNEFGCGNCHEDAVANYDKSVHYNGRRANGRKGATCADCHGGHHIVEVADATSPVARRNLPDLCSHCHAQEGEITADFVRLPVAVPNYLASVHGTRWQEGKDTAICIDCHGYHDIGRADDPKSRINRFNLAETCGQCHKDIAQEYGGSIHGRALALGLSDAPSCTDCHDEHLIKPPGDITARINPEQRARELCGDCHTRPELAAKYGIPSGVVSSYLDSYHGWAVARGSDLVATCTDCHTVHDIRSPLDPASSVYSGNVAATCSKCHTGANDAFAASYTHVTALKARGLHGWVRLVYFWLIGIVLGGMALHNFIVARYELAKSLRQREKEPYVERWQSAERIQHIVLLLSFTGLALTGFALRYPTAWWTHLLGLSISETVRSTLHRTLGVILIVAAFYHVAWVFATRRGRMTVANMAPRYWDVSQFVKNMAFHLRLRNRRPAFRKFDYTQKAEYWAVVWGTWVMVFTGLVLWFPIRATGWAPAWIVRVSEVIHFYEAVLAVSAIVIWHFFYVIFMPSEYPMSTIWLNGRMPAEEWKELHRAEFQEMGEASVRWPDRGGRPAGPKKPGSGRPPD